MINSANLITIFVFLLSFLLFLTPGLFLYKLHYPRSSTSETIIVGSPIGIGLSALLCSLVGWLINFNPYYCLLFIVGLSVAFWISGKKYSGQYKLGEVEKNHIDLSLYYFAAITTILIGISYSSFGVKTPQGYAFKDLYETDLLHHMSVFIHLPKGIPPINPYFSGYPWHYYWISHMLPAFIYSISGFALSPRNIMLFISVSYSLIFLTGFFFLLTSFFKDKKVIRLLMILSLLAYGYNDIFVMFKYSVLTLSESQREQFYLNYFISDIHSDLHTGYSHGWFRNFLVEPHSTLAISILFVVIILLRREGMFIPKKRENILRGVLFGMIFSIDAFIGTISICWYTLAIIKEYVSKKIPLDEFIYYTIWVFLPIGMIFIFLYELKIISPGYSYLIFKPYFKMITLSPIYFLIDYGPMSLLGISGIYLLIRNKEIKNYFPYIILAVTCLFFIFFINLSHNGTTQMFRKGGMVFRIPLVLFSGVCLQYLFDKYHGKKIFIILWLSIILALPTPIIDIYMLSNWKTGASFIKQEDFKALHWIKTNLPKNCIIQDFPTAITPLLAFGERRVAIGDWEHAKSSGIIEEEITSRLDDIRKIFETDNPTVAFNLAQKYSISYIYINKLTQDKFVEGSKKFNTQTNLFRKVYGQDGVSVFKVIDPAIETNL